METDKSVLEISDHFDLRALTSSDQWVSGSEEVSSNQNVVDLGGVGGVDSSPGEFNSVASELAEFV